MEVRLRPEAERDIWEAALWYEQQLPRLGHDFLDELLVALSAMADAPLMYPLVHRETRRQLMKRFPFGIYYRVEDSLIVVLAVMHGSRDPNRWKTRI
ncbi:MAG: type II toxin-antitoxin system RelE/ParE family toxin [Trueperaceae bacterium]